MSEDYFNKQLKFKELNSEYGYLDVEGLQELTSCLYHDMKHRKKEVKHEKISHRLSSDKKTSRDKT